MNRGVFLRYGHLFLYPFEKDTYYYPENLNLSIKIIIMVDNWVTMNIILIFE
jgi:hypothetical protein